MSNFLKRFFTYQLERFPLFILIFTTLAVVSSSFTVASGGMRWGKLTAVAFVTGLLFTLQMRLFDEFKDFQHDLKYYPTRPVSRGLLSLKELKILNSVTILAEFFINLFVPLKALLSFCIAFLYSLLTEKEFFLRNWIRQHFFTYSFLHYLQMAFIIVYFYVLAGADVTHPSALLWLHFLFTNLTLTLIEWARKMRTKSEENESKDTYSAQLGIRGSSIIFGVMILVIFILFYKIRIDLRIYNIGIWFGLSSFVLVALANFFYAYKKTKMASNILLLTSVIFFVLLHFLV